MTNFERLHDILQNKYKDYSIEYIPHMKEMYLFVDPDNIDGKRFHVTYRGQGYLHLTEYFDALCGLIIKEICLSGLETLNN